MNAKVFDLDCQRCPRLVQHLQTIRQRYPEYHAKPVPAFGDLQARLLVVGLAPGLHGANATGRPFTGDYAGILLYETLFEVGFSSAPESRHADDGLVLYDCRITNAVKCLPPENKPTGAEVQACNAFLQSELQALPVGAVVLALGGIAHRAVVKALGKRQVDFPFAHGAEHRLPEGRILLDSYHCSKYNTQTRRLTKSMFQQVMARARALLSACRADRQPSTHV